MLYVIELLVIFFNLCAFRDGKIQALAKKFGCEKDSRHLGITVHIVNKDNE
jgi:hypothetical protein